MPERKRGYATIEDFAEWLEARHERERAAANERQLVVDYLAARAAEARARLAQLDAVLAALRR